MAIRRRSLTVDEDLRVREIEADKRTKPRVPYAPGVRDVKARTHTISGKFLVFGSGLGGEDLLNIARRTEQLVESKCSITRFALIFVLVISFGFRLTATWPAGVRTLSALLLWIGCITGTGMTGKEA